MKSKYIKRCGKVTALLLVMLFIFLFLANLMQRTSTNAEAYVRNFYREPKNSIDVCMIGCSELYADFCPPIAYEHSGFTSYNLSYPSALGLYYNSMLDEMLKTQTPQLVVFETNGFTYTENANLSEGNHRRWLDNMRKDENWYNCIKENIAEEDQINYLFPFLKYHSNWDKPIGLAERVYSLSLNAGKDGRKLKCFATRTTSDSKIKVQRQGASQMTPYGKEVLLDTIEHCHELGIENVLFVRMPHKDHISEETEKQFNDIITEGGYDFLNMDKLVDEIGLDDNTDFYNRDHMNVFGNEKNTVYLADYIMENYDINTEHSEKVDNDWKDCAEYANEAFAILKERTLENEDLYYITYTDLSDTGHYIQLKWEEIKARDNAAKEKRQKEKADIDKQFDEGGDEEEG